MILALHVADSIRTDIAERVGGLIWKRADDDAPGPGVDEEPDDGQAGAPVPAN